MKDNKAYLQITLFTLGILNHDSILARYAGVRIGPVVRKDVMRASTMLEHEEKYACILAFDVKV